MAGWLWSIPVWALVAWGIVGGIRHWNKPLYGEEDDEQLDPSDRRYWL